jgi:hypothetical protein
MLTLGQLTFPRADADFRPGFQFHRLLC